MASVSHLLLLLLCSYHVMIASAVDVQSYKILATSSQKPQAVCSEPTGTLGLPLSSGATVPLNHRQGPCSPVVSSEKKPTLEELLRRDQLRAGYVQRKFSNNNHRANSGLQSSEATVPTTLGSSLDTLEYVITVELGSPAVKQTMIIDTGSDVSWVHSSSGSPFDPAKSSTYVPLSCGAPACTQLGGEGNGCSKNGQCQYMVMYGDGSNTTGGYGSDKLALTASETVDSFQFGCSQVEEGFRDKTDGLMGLGGDTQSLVSQTAATYGKAFSYCLPPTTSSSGFLTLGAPSGGTSGFATTGMLRSPQARTFYGALLQGISVGGKMVGVAPSVFSAGSVMDSGTIITRLPPTAYKAFSTAFKEGMKQYQSVPARSILDTCFDFSGQDNVTIPSVSLVFDGGAVVDLDANGIIYGSCLAFTATDDDGTTGIIGNVQQRTLEVLYDVGKSVLGFRANAC
ncbi:hypothetical protein QYE76_025279 [Lolium multiflorum]|uniref:Peptidase A1 domain-containing protein n=1 Tax=Lolium multiflorum TaxID=4521 RepID=A0AAD8REX1_LOLMU|nr:hypothetical protein QYE76_025279 [Lolium multiflorum]